MMNRGKIIKILFVALLLVGCQAAPYSYSDKFSVKVPDISQSDITLSGKHDFYGTEQILSGTKNLKQFSVLYISTGGSAVIAERLLFRRLCLSATSDAGGRRRSRHHTFRNRKTSELFRSSRVHHKMCSLIRWSLTSDTRIHRLFNGPGHH